jgi:hypothetical protein
VLVLRDQAFQTGGAIAERESVSCQPRLLRAVARKSDRNKKPRPESVARSGPICLHSRRPGIASTPNCQPDSTGPCFARDSSRLRKIKPSDLLSPKDSVPEALCRVLSGRYERVRIQLRRRVTSIWWPTDRCFDSNSAEWLNSEALMTLWTRARLDS